jgi:hypothetical protein
MRAWLQEKATTLPMSAFVEHFHMQGSISAKPSTSFWCKTIWAKSEARIFANVRHGCEDEHQRLGSKPVWAAANLERITRTLADRTINLDVASLGTKMMMAALALLNARGVTSEHVPEPVRLNRAKAKRGRCPQGPLILYFAMLGKLFGMRQG